MAAIKRLLAQPAILLVGLLSFIGLQANAAAVGSNAVRDDFSQMSKRQATSFYPIEGFKTKVVERRSITTLQSQYPDIFNMLLLAWRNLQLRGENLDLSYFKVAGIHGAPYEPWQYPPSATKNPNMGYCTHQSGLFLAWHRPYLVLIEQLLHDEAVAIAKNFTGAAATKYQSAADNVRLPYWDWASKGTESTMPPVVRQSSITVTRPAAGGTPTATSIPNPLLAYRFINSHSDIAKGAGATTVRDPNSGSFNFGADTRSQTYTSFASTNKYNEYQNLLENGPHGSVHINVGGDMAFISRSAFDPIFWLHHCNVDRLMAMYQATHPGEYMTPTDRSPTFALAAGGQDTLQTQLFPFRHQAGNEWISDQLKTVQSIFTMGYSYPEVPQGMTTSGLKTFTTGRISALYGPNTAVASFAGARSGAAALPNARREWSINVITDPRDFSGSHRINFFLGSSNEAIARANIFKDTNDKPTSGKQINITVPITSSLVDKQVSLQPEEAVPTLKDLRWTVVKLDETGGSDVPVSNFPSLRIAVTSAIVDNKPDQLPEITGVLTHFTPTLNKPGGIKPGDPAPVGDKAPPSLDSPTVPAGNSTSS